MDEQPKRMQATGVMATAVCAAVIFAALGLAVSLTARSDLTVDGWRSEVPPIWQWLPVGGPFYIAAATSLGFAGLFAVLDGR